MGHKNVHVVLSKVWLKKLKLKTEIELYIILQPQSKIFSGDHKETLVGKDILWQNLSIWKVLKLFFLLHYKI